MYASEVITQLKELMDNHGDLRVADERDYSFGGFEFNNDDGEVFVFDLNNSDNE